MKKIADFFNVDGSNLQFAIKREIRRDGTEKLVPVVRQKGMFQQWMPIVSVDTQWMALPVETEMVHTEASCNVYIKAYQSELAKQSGKKVKEIVYQEV